MIRHAISILSLSLCLSACNDTDVAGGSEIGNPHPVSLSGKLHSEAGCQQKDSVYLYAAQANPEEDTPLAVSISSADGKFQFDSIMSLNHYRLFARRVCDDTPEMAYLDTLILRDDSSLNQVSFKTPVEITLNASALAQNQGTILYIAGLPISVKIEGNELKIKLPEGSIDIVHFDPAKKEILDNGLNYKEVKLDKDKDWKIGDKLLGDIKPATGETKCVINTDYTFAASEVTSSLGHDMKYRFATVNYDTASNQFDDYWEGAEISEWQEDLDFTTSYPWPGLNKIRVQARSVQDSTLETRWSDYHTCSTTAE